MRSLHRLVGNAPATNARSGHDMHHKRNHESHFDAVKFLSDLETAIAKRDGSPTSPPVSHPAGPPIGPQSLEKDNSGQRCRQINQIRSWTYVFSELIISLLYLIRLTD